MEIDQTVLFSLVSCRAFVRARARAGDEEARTLDAFCDAIADLDAAERLTAEELEEAIETLRAQQEGNEDA